MNKTYWRHRLRAQFFLFINRRSQAIDDLERMLAIDPAHTATKNTLGVLYGEISNFQFAEKHFKSALQDTPDDADTLFNLGFVQQKQQLHREAITTLSAAIRINPKLDRAWFGRGMSCSSLGLHEQAISDFEEAAKLQPLNPHALFELGMQYHATKNSEKVLEIIKRMREFDPKATQQLIQATQSTLEPLSC